MDSKAAALARIKELQAQSRALTAKLERSLRIQALWPEAFDLGPVTGYLIGTKAGDNMRYVIRRSDGEQREFTLEQWKD